MRKLSALVGSLMSATIVASMLGVDLRSAASDIDVRSVANDVKEYVSSSSSKESARVVEVVDGDTIKVRVDRDVVTVRVIGIDTPETKKPGVGKECGGPAATKNAKRLLPAGKAVRLVEDPTQDSTDRYGRRLAYVDVDGGSLQQRQLSAGLAKVYVYGKPFKRLKSFKALEDKAKARHRGVWGTCRGDFHSGQGQGR